jgi:N-acetyl-gamma-glutamylphosphate reductase
MKLIIGGSTGLVGTELLRQALSHPAITSIVGLSRRETQLPAGAPNSGKLRSIVVDDFEHYSDAVRKELEDADACIWYCPSALSCLISPSPVTI